MELIIETPRLLLRPMNESDASIIVKWRNDEEDSKFFLNRQPNLNSHKQWFHSERQARVDYIIVHKHEQKPIGTLNFKNISNTAEAGKLIGEKSFRGQGLAKESFIAWLYYGFKKLLLEEVYIQTHELNIINIAINDKLGFQKVDPCKFKLDARNSFVTMAINEIQFDRANVLSLDAIKVELS